MSDFHRYERPPTPDSSSSSEDEDSDTYNLVDFEELDIDALTTNTQTRETLKKTVWEICPSLVRMPGLCFSIVQVVPTPGDRKADLKLLTRKVAADDDAGAQPGERVGEALLGLFGYATCSNMKWLDCVRTENVLTHDGQVLEVRFVILCERVGGRDERYREWFEWVTEKDLPGHAMAGAVDGWKEMWEGAIKEGRRMLRKRNRAAKAAAREKGE